MKFLHPMTAIGIAIGGVLIAGSAHAVTQPRQSVSLPTNYCQAALPAFEGLIRKRPLAVQNEGQATAFITCSYPSGEGRFSGSVTTRVWQYFLNNSEADITINCTGVSGQSSFTDTPQFIIKSLVVPPGSITSEISWFASDFAGAPAVFPGQGQFSTSCAIPPGGGLRQAYVNSDTDVGN